MLKSRITPCLLIRNKGLVKTKNFKPFKYIGDPINAIRIFNEKEADELIVLDIDATTKGLNPDFSIIKKIAPECRMPLCYGGGVKTVEHAEHIISLGVEKVAVSSAFIANPQLVADISSKIGSQSVVVVLDVKKNFLGNYEVYTHNGSIRTKKTPIELATLAVKFGAGEVVINSIDLDGAMNGYDLTLAKNLRDAVNVPISIMGGAGNLEDMKSLFKTCGVVGAIAGSLFVFKGALKAVLINYPSAVEKDGLVENN
jgi:imidazole glycerol-phosphate synthase subunit HisF